MGLFPLCTTHEMAEADWSDNVAAPAADASAEVPEIKLFGKWPLDEVQLSDMSLQDYIAVKKHFAKYLPHSAGRYASKRFRKAQCPIVERLTNSLMMHGRNNGKKLMAVRIVKHSFEIIHLLTGENPVQVVVNAIITPAPREPGHLAADHRRARGRLQEHQDHRRVPRRRAHQRSQGILQQLRYQEERRAGARCQVQPSNKLSTS